MPWSDVSQLLRGDVVTIAFPFTDFTGQKTRPAILVTDTLRVRGPDGHFVFIGSQPPPTGVRTIPLHRGTPEAAAMGLTFPPDKPVSYIYAAKVVTLAVHLIKARIGRAPPATLAEITGIVRDTLGC